MKRRATIARPRGFTLVEAIAVIAVTGVVAATVAVFVRAPVLGYVDTARRLELADAANTATRRIGRDLRLALPNSVRVSSSGSTVALEFLLLRSGGRYRAEPDGGGLGDVLDFTSAADASFDVLGAAVEVGAGDQIVVYNLGVPGADAYAGANRRAYPGAAGTVGNIAFTPTASPFPFASPSQRFQVVQTAVSYICDTSARTLTRYWGYAIVAAQPNPPVGGNSALIASDVSACTITYDPLVVAYRAGLVTLRVTLDRDGEAVSLYHAVHVSNVP